MCFEIFQSRVGFLTALERALVGFLARVTTHMHDKHVHGLKRFFFAGALLPSANVGLLVSLYVILL